MATQTLMKPQVCLKQQVFMTFAVAILRQAYRWSLPQPWVLALQRGLESAFAGAFTASMRYEGSSIFISGTLANRGRIGDAGSDKPEAIMLLSAGTHISSHLALITYPQDRIFSARSILKPYAFSTPSHVSIRIRLYCSRNACPVQLESKSIHVFKDIVIKYSQADPYD